MVPTIRHDQLPDGQWLATSRDLYPMWKRVTDEQDKPGAEKSLKSHISRHMKFAHYGWNGKT